MSDLYTERNHFIVICSITSSISIMSQLLLPLIIGTLASINHLDAGTLGFLAFIEIGAAALTGFAIAVPLGRFNPAFLAGAGAVVAGIGNAASVLTGGHIALLLAMRLISGIGLGLNRAGIGALVSGLRDPERMFSILGFAPCVMALAAFGVAPWLIAVTGGAGGTFGFLAVLSAIDAALLLTQSRRLNAFTASEREYADTSPGTRAVPPMEQFPDAQSSEATGQGELEGVRQSARISAALIALILAISLVSLFADSLLWNFVVAVGEESGIPLADSSFVLMAVSIVCCVAPPVSVYVGARFGAAAPIILSQIALVPISALVVSTSNTIVFTAYMSLREAIIIFLMLRYSGLAARLDATGGLASAVSSAQSIGTAIGPLIGGQMVLLAGGSYVILGTTASVGSAVCCALSVPFFLGYTKYVGSKASKSAREPVLTARSSL